MWGDDPLVSREEVARPSLARPILVKRTPPTPEKAPPAGHPSIPLAGEREAAAFDAAASAGAASAPYTPSSDTPSLGSKVRFPPDPCDGSEHTRRARRGVQPIGDTCMLRVSNTERSYAVRSSTQSAVNAAEVDYTAVGPCARANGQGFHAYVTLRPSSFRLPHLYLQPPKPGASHFNSSPRVGAAVLLAGWLTRTQTS